MEKIGNIAEFKRGPFGSSIKKSVCVNKGKNTFKLYEQGNVINNDFERDRYYLTPEKFAELSHFEIQPGDLLLTCAGTLGRIAIVPDNIQRGIINSVLMRIRVNKERVIIKYLYYYFQSPKIQNDISKQSAGVAIKNLFSTRLLKEYTLHLPNKKEQKLIVAEIETQLTRLDSAIESLQTIKKKLEVYRKSVLRSSFKKQDDWITSKIILLCDKIEQKDPKKEHFKYFTYIDIASIDNSIKKITNPKIIESRNAPSRARQISKEGDVIYSSVRTYLKNIAIVPKFKEPIFSSTGFVVMRPSKINNKFLFYYLLSDELNNAMTKKQVGTSYPAIKKKDLLDFVISFPQNADNQINIVQDIESQFSVIDKLEEIINASLLKAETLKKSILKSAFEGKLVRYNDND
jgi:type I restriction enzyme, S subunit